MDIVTRNGEVRPSVRDYFKGKTLFMTGATGFVGRFLIYKLLKDCDIKRFYILLREKKGQTIDERYETSATKLHVYGTENIVRLVKKIVNLDVFMHVSSIGAWCTEDVLEERVMTCPINPRQFVEKMESMSESEAIAATKDYIGKPPKFMNTYCFTKTLAEGVVFKEKDGLTIGLVRPPFLYSCAREPEMGWFDTPQTGAGLSVLFSLGLARIASLRLDDPVECIPVDLCVNSMISTCWYMATVARENGEKFKVFNMGMSQDAAYTGRKLQSMGIELGYRYPSTKQIRPPIEPYNFVPSQPYIKLKAFFTHTLFSIMIDTLLVLTGQKPILVKLTSKILGAVSQIFEVICSYKEELKIEMGNIDLLYGKQGVLGDEDKEIFLYDLKSIDWPAVGVANHMRFRRTILKEPDSNLPWARKRLKMLEVGYKIFKLCFYAAVLAFFYGTYTLVESSIILSAIYWFITITISAIMLYC
ncbi:Fatty acyl-CoA reductase 1 [Halotydeus destructor]|nr:Fatty acyl-CoA reductase 1 [Halotydeus destructor]